MKRFADLDGPDYFPTPAWATHALADNEKFDGEIWESACGDGAMSACAGAVRLPGLRSSDLYRAWLRRCRGRLSRPLGGRAGQHRHQPAVQQRRGLRIVPALSEGRSKIRATCFGWRSWRGRTGLTNDLQQAPAVAGSGSSASASPSTRPALSAKGVGDDRLCVVRLGSGCAGTEPKCRWFEARL